MPAPPPLDRAQNLRPNHRHDLKARLKVTPFGKCRPPRKAAETGRLPRLVAAARRWLGTPYHHQASLRDVGCDCLGLVRGVWRDLYGPEPEPTPPYSQHWAQHACGETLALAAARHLVEIEPPAARPGDVLLFRWRAHLPAAHCAILVEPERILHAHDGAAVGEVAFTRWWRRHCSHAFAFPELDA